MFKMLENAHRTLATEIARLVPERRLGGGASAEAGEVLASESVTSFAEAPAELQLMLKTYCMGLAVEDPVFAQLQSCSDGNLLPRFVAYVKLTVEANGVSDAINVFLGKIDHAEVR